MVLKMQVASLEARLNSIEEKTTESAIVLKKITDTGEIKIPPRKTGELPQV